MVAVVKEIVRTINAAENAISVLVTTPNFDLFIDLSLSFVVGPPAVTHLEVCIGRRTAVDDLVSRACLRLWFWDWSPQWRYADGVGVIGSYCLGYV